MGIQEMRELLSYDEWANSRMLEAIASLTEEQLAFQHGGSFGSLRDLVGHLVAVEWVWLRRCTGDSPAAPPPWMAAGTLPELRARLTEVEAERRRWLAAQGDDDADREVAYALLDGTRGRRRLGTGL
jgi:uncharacterized damage-inducible protein DinB